MRASCSLESGVSGELSSTAQVSKNAMSPGVPRCVRNPEDTDVGTGQTSAGHALVRSADAVAPDDIVAIESGFRVEVASLEAWRGSVPERSSHHTLCDEERLEHSFHSPARVHHQNAVDTTDVWPRGVVVEWSVGLTIPVDPEPVVFASKDEVVHGPELLWGELFSVGGKSVGSNLSTRRIALRATEAVCVFPLVLSQPSIW